MMNKNLPYLSAFLISALLFVTTSCEQEDDAAAPIVVENQAISDPNAFLSTAEVSEINFGGIIYKFQYGSNNMIEEVEESFSFEIEEEGTVVTIDLLSHYDLNYTDKRLTTMEVEADLTYSMIVDGEKQVVGTESDTYNVTAQYNNKKLLSSLTETYEDNTIIKMVREYNAENKLIKESHIEDGVQNQYQTYSWTGMNVDKDTLFYQEDEFSERKINSISTLRKNRIRSFTARKLSQAALQTEENIYSSYDNKKNPLNVLSLFGFSNGIFISNNNPTSITFSNGDGEGTIRITHTSDSQGRLKTYSMTDPLMGPISIELKYKN